MSNVYLKDRGISDMEFYRNAEELRSELSKLLFRDKTTPKKYRAVVSYKAVDTVNRMMTQMHKANRIFAYTQEEVDQRKRIQQECIDCVDELYEIFQYAIKNVWWQKLHAVDKDTGEPTNERLRLEKHLTDIGGLLDREEQLLIGWRRSTKLLRKH